MAVGIFEESEQNKSYIRIASFISLITSVTFGAITLLHDGAATNANGIYVTTLFAILAFAPKSVQKFAEKWAEWKLNK